MENLIDKSPVQQLSEHIAPRQQALASHPAYASIKTADDLRRFMETHVFAVWDFMCLLKSLQRALTCVDAIWRPVPEPEVARFINEIVLGEETDLDPEGHALSHFELYRKAMHEAGANTRAIDTFISALNNGTPWRAALETCGAPTAAKSFVQQTLELVEAGELHKIAAAFTFGREEVIPDMFTSLVDQLAAKQPGQFGLFKYYLERHIELDGDEHGPLALKLIAALIGDDAKKAADVEATALAAIDARERLWDGVADDSAVGT
ncbi:MAG: DUF3050 domain-containing protein [Bacteroidota bacterium]